MSAAAATEAAAAAGEPAPPKGYARALLIAVEEEVEALADALLELGALSVSVEDVAADTDAEQPLYGEPGLQPARPAWAQSRLSVLFDDTRARDEALAQLVCARLLTSAQIEACDHVPERDWVRLTQAQFDPIVVDAGGGAPRIAIAPSWHPLPPAEVQLRLDPGAGFGTGGHATTHLCLQWLAAHADSLVGRSLLDYGCGSGILALAASKLGARPCAALDIDPAALEATRHNAEVNGVELELLSGEMHEPRRYDLVVANILAAPLKVLAPLLASHLAPGGRLLLSGILARQRDELIEAYAAHLPLALWGEREGWICLSGRVEAGRGEER
jgi:ribosomal protein L11 methyltransferase